jgi:RHS repeat-associated protein
MLAEERIAQMGLARTTPRVKGNCDGVVSAYDIDPFVLALTNPTQYQQEYPDCDIMRADLNGDGVRDGYDIDYLTGVTGASAITFEWDAENRLTAVYPVSPGEGDQKVEFKYDYLGRRIEKSVYDWASGDWSATASEVRRFVWAGWLMLAELDGDNQPVRKYTWGLDLAGQSGVQGSALPEALEAAGGIGGLLAVEQVEVGGGTGQGGVDAGNYVFAYDGNGNVVQVLDWAAASATAAIVAKYEYDPYGKVVASDGDYADVNPFRFSTKYWDDETGLGYWLHRYCSPRIGRWISRDPDEETDSAHLYMYCGNAGTNSVDSFGLARACTFAPAPAHADGSGISKPTYNRKQVRICTRETMKLPVVGGATGLKGLGVKVAVCQQKWVPGDTTVAGKKCECLWSVKQLCRKVCCSTSWFGGDTCQVSNVLMGCDDSYIPPTYGRFGFNLNDPWRGFDCNCPEPAGTPAQCCSKGAESRELH